MLTVLCSCKRTLHPFWNFQCDVISWWFKYNYICKQILKKLLAISIWHLADAKNLCWGSWGLRNRLRHITVTLDWNYLALTILIFNNTIEKPPNSTIWRPWNPCLSYPLLSWKFQTWNWKGHGGFNSPLQWWLLLLFYNHIFSSLEVSAHWFTALFPTHVYISSMGNLGMKICIGGLIERW